MKSFHKAKSNTFINATLVNGKDLLHVEKLKDLLIDLCEIYDILPEDVKLIFRERNGSYHQCFFFTKTGVQLPSTTWSHLKKYQQQAELKMLDRRHLIVLGSRDLHDYQIDGYWEYKTLEPYVPTGQKGYDGWVMLFLHEFAHVIQSIRFGRKRGEIHNADFIRILRELIGLAL